MPKVWSANLNRENLQNELFHELTDLETWLRPPYPKESFRAVGRHQLYYLAYQDTNNLEILKKYGQISFGRPLFARTGAWPQLVVGAAADHDRGPRGRFTMTND